MVGMGASYDLVKRVADKVKKLPCHPENLKSMQEQYKVGSSVGGVERGYA